MKPLVPDVSWGNCVEKIVGLAYTVSRNQENLATEGGRLVLPSWQASVAWRATWAFWESLGLTPNEEVARLEEEQRPVTSIEHSAASGATEHGPVTSSTGDGAGHTPAADSAHDATTAGAAEQSGAPGDTEHGPETILSLASLKGLATQQKRDRTKDALHCEARRWLDYIANGAYGIENVIDLRTRWPKWSAWLATQPEATQSFARDVASFTAEAIENTTDPNRGGRPRVDFCVRLVDGSYWRFHPGQDEQERRAGLHTSDLAQQDTRCCRARGATMEPNQRR